MSKPAVAGGSSRHPTTSSELPVLPNVNKQRRRHANKSLILQMAAWMFRWLHSSMRTAVSNEFSTSWAFCTSQSCGFMMLKGSSVPGKDRRAAEEATAFFNHAGIRPQWRTSSTLKDGRLHGILNMRSTTAESASLVGAARWRPGGGASSFARERCASSSHRILQFGPYMDLIRLERDLLLLLRGPGVGAFDKEASSRAISSGVVDAMAARVALTLCCHVSGACCCSS